MGSAPTAVPTGNAGSRAAALAKIAEAVQSLLKVLPELGHGSEEFNKVLQSVNSLSKIAPPSAQIPGVQKSAAESSLQDANKNAMMAMLARNASPGGASAGGGAPPPGGGGPPTPAMPPSLAA